MVPNVIKLTNFKGGIYVLNVLNPYQSPANDSLFDITLC